MSDEPLDLFFERLVEGEPVSRRDVLKRMAAAGLIVGPAASLLAACGGVEGTKNENANQATTASHPKAAAVGNVTVSNWPYYIAKTTVSDWEKETGGNMKYVEDYNDNEEFFAKVRQELEAGRPIGREIVVPTDWMAARWIDLGYAEPIDKTNVPNAKNLVDTLASPPYDPERNFTLPWQSGITGIGYDKKKTGREIKSVNDLFDPKFKGRVSMFSEWRDSAGLVLLGEGKDPTTASKDDYLEAIAKIDEQSRNGQIRRFTGNDYTKDLAIGNLWVCVAWAGDVVALKQDNPNLEFATPEQGGMTWSDNMLMPKHEKNYYAAETFMNFVYQPEVAAKITEAYNYFSPVDGTKQVLEKTNPELASSQLVFPDEATLSQLHAYPALDAAQEREVTAEMQKVTGA